MSQFSAILPPALPQALSARRLLCIAVIFVSCYLLVAWATRVYLVRPYAIVPWNPSAGLALAFLLIMGVRFWPVLALASFLNLLVRGVPTSSFALILAPLVIAGGHTGMAWLLRGPAGFRIEFNRLRDVAALVAVAALGTLLVAIAYVYVVRLDNFMPWEMFQRLVLRSWIGHLIGVVVFTPLLLLLATAWSGIRSELQSWHPVEMLAQICAIVLALWMIFGSRLLAPAELLYLLFVPLIWVAARRGILGAVLCSTLIQFALIAAIVLWDSHNHMSVTELQFLMLVLTVTTLFLGMAVTESRTALDARNRSEARLHTIVSTAPDGIMTVNNHGVIIAVNPAGTHIFGYMEKGLIGTPVREVLPEFQRIARFDRVGETTGIRRDGTRFPAELAVGASGNGSEALSIAITRDITRRKEFEHRLAVQQSEIQHMARLSAAGEVAAALAHELHQPLAAIRNYARAASMLTRSSGGNDIADKMEREAARAAEIVQRLRDFFRTGSSLLENISVQKLVEDAVGPMRIEAARQNIALTTDVACAEIMVLIDRVQVETVMHSLIGNAFEAMATAGSTARRVTIAATQSDGLWVRISVIDTGPGISPDISARLFEPFATSKPTGIGLGLSLSRSIVEAHGGKLWAEPAAGGGTAFHFMLPRAEKEEAIGYR